MKKEYNKILQLIESRINNLDNSAKNKSINEDVYLFEREKFCKLYKLISNKYQNFFSEVTMEIALEILQDVGISKSEVMSIYQKLIMEDIDSQYILYDEDDDENILEKNNK